MARSSALSDSGKNDSSVLISDTGSHGTRASTRSAASSTVHTAIRWTQHGVHGLADAVSAVRNRGQAIHGASEHRLAAGANSVTAESTIKGTRLCTFSRSADAVATFRQSLGAIYGTAEKRFIGAAQVIAAITRVPAIRGAAVIGFTRPANVVTAIARVGAIRGTAVIGFARPAQVIAAGVRVGAIRRTVVVGFAELALIVTTIR